jgi:hypothetical protein
LVFGNAIFRRKVDIKNATCHYFDFGRYHTPFDHGRARGAVTDPDLTVRTKPVISDDGKELVNFKEILTELQLNPSCHGDGRIHASYAPNDFEKAFEKAMEMQNVGAIPYGHFRYKGSNCSRFVNTVLNAGKPGWKASFRLNFLVPLTPTPMNNVQAFGKRLVVENRSGREPSCPAFRLNKKQLKSTLPPPERHPNIPENAQWLAGEGAGSWFHIEPDNTVLKVTRFSPMGAMEFTGQFEQKSSPGLSIDNKAFTISYPSNYKNIIIKLDEQEVYFCRIEV